jgi:hypothetical protein
MVAGARDLGDVQVRYRFKEEDFVNNIKDEQLAKNDKAKEPIYYKVRNT